jgi:putative FmdB family regulatory protein
MPFYEFSCKKCGSRAEVFARSISAPVTAPKCAAAGRERGHEMQRIMSKVIRQKTLTDQLAEAEAKYGKEVEAALGQSPDVGRMARRYESLAKDLPPEP